MEPTPSNPRSRPRGIYLLPNLFTTGGMFAGFYAIIAAINNDFVVAAVAIFVAGVLDGIDGRVARLTGTQSEFGVQYDSLADLVSFGLAPALVMYLWALVELKTLGNAAGKLGWSVAFLYAACAAVRLARFNTQASVVDKKHFIGLASPAAAGMLMAFVWLMNEEGFAGADVAWGALALTAVVALLMVSRIRYFSFKQAPASERMPFLLVPTMIGVFVLLAINPPLVLTVVGAVYLASGPLIALFGWMRRRRAEAST
jgi:CDP-diacylglycerol--serine O-phosphatidyltransferase